MLETKLFPDWKPRMIMLRYIHQAQQTSTSTIEALGLGVKHAQNSTSWKSFL